MKNLPYVTIALWLSMILGVIFFPQLLLKEIVQFPLVVLFSTLLPVSFWITIREKKRIIPLVMIAILLTNSGILLYALETNYRSEKNLANSVKTGVYPEFVETLTIGTSPEQREFAARYIYQQFAVAAPYKTSDNSLALYAPSETDKEKYRANSLSNAQLAGKQMDAVGQMLGAFFLLLLHVGIFLLLLVFLCVYENKSAPATTRPGI